MLGSIKKPAQIMAQLSIATGKTDHSIWAECLISSKYMKKSQNYLRDKRVLMYCKHENIGCKKWPWSIFKVYQLRIGQKTRDSP